MYIFNAQVLHRKCGGKLQLLSFRQRLVETTVDKQYTGKAKRERPSLEEDPLWLKERYTPENVSATDNKKCFQKVLHVPTQQNTQEITVSVY